MIVTGVTGSAWRASITPWGAIEPWDDGAAALDWYVAADDRWHVPAEESAVRQVRVGGTPVTETRVRVPHGDVVQRVYSTADAGGLTIVEVENASTLPVAIAFTRRDVLTERPIAAIPIEGIDLPADAFVLPLGHAASLRVGIAHGPQRDGPLPAGLPSARQVANGWQTLTERGSRFVLPDGELGAGLADRVTALRCELALGSVPSSDDDPAGFAVALGELVRMGERADHWLPELVASVERLGPDASWSSGVALAAADRVLAAAGEDRARRDLARIIAARPRATRPASPPDGATAIAWLETTFADGGALLPAGLPVAWLGASVEVYGVPTSATGTVSYALRWHGARPAILWEQTGEPTTLSSPVMAPDWSTAEPSGEALWPPPPVAPPAAPATAGEQRPPDEPVSFS